MVRREVNIKRIFYNSKKSALEFIEVFAIGGSQITELLSTIDSIRAQKMDLIEWKKS